MQVKHLLYSGPKEHLQALETLQSLVEITMAPHRAFASTKVIAQIKCMYCLSVSQNSHASRFTPFGNSTVSSDTSCGAT